MGWRIWWGECSRWNGNRRIPRDDMNGPLTDQPTQPVQPANPTQPNQPLQSNQLSPPNQLAKTNPPNQARNIHGTSMEHGQFVYLCGSQRPGHHCPQRCTLARASWHGTDGNKLGKWLSRGVGRQGVQRCHQWMSIATTCRLRMVTNSLPPLLEHPHNSTDLRHLAMLTS